MSLRLGDIAPNFQQASSEGEIDFLEGVLKKLGRFNHKS